MYIPTAFEYLRIAKMLVFALFGRTFTLFVFWVGQINLLREFAPHDVCLGFAWSTVTSATRQSADGAQQEHAKVACAILWVTCSVLLQMIVVFVFMHIGIQNYKRRAPCNIHASSTGSIMVPFHPYQSPGKLHASSMQVRCRFHTSSATVKH